jgi:tRNA(Ile)-lysidine synthase
MALTQRVLDTIHRHALLGGAGAARVLVALSGGADSVALLFLLRELEAQGRLRVAGAAHLNHQLRGADADADEAFCAALAGRLGLPFASERVDVAALARAQKRSIEDAGRTARYAFFERAARSLGADAVAVAHTKDDQAETFLLRLLRGAATRGLAAIHPRARLPTEAPETRAGLPTVAPKARRWVIRPLLDIERAALREYLADLGETFREDASNADVAVPRNRVRHELIPLLASRFSPRATDVLARAAALARDEEDFLRAEAIKLAPRIVLTENTPRGSTLVIDAAALRGAPRAIASRVVHAALQRHAGQRPIHFDHVERVLALAALTPLSADGSGAGGGVSLPGQDAVRVGRTIQLRPRADDGRRLAHRRRGGRASHASARVGNSFAFSLSIPGEVALGPQGLAVAAERLAGTGNGGTRPRKWAARGVEVGISARAVQLPLSVRSRRPGDRFRPLGAPGARKLQDFFVDRKVPRAERDTVPLVVDGDDRIVWVVGQSVAEDFRVIDPSLGVILLKVRHLGGPG